MKESRSRLREKRECASMYAEEQGAQKGNHSATREHEKEKTV